MARGRGPIGGGGAWVLDTLVVQITCDLSGLSAGIGQAIAEINTLKGAIASRVGGVSLGDAMTAALVAPLAVATARIGQVRNEMRLLSTELRSMAALTHGGGAAGRNAGAVVVGSALGAGVIDATRTGRTRGADGRYASGWSADLTGGRPGLNALAGTNNLLTAGGLRAEMDSRAASHDAMLFGVPGGGDDEPRGRRRRNWFQRTFSPSVARRAFQTGQREFPGYTDAADNLGASAHGVGAGARRGLGSGLARTLGLVGVGALFGDLIALAASLATVIGGALAGAFAAAATPIGLVVVGLTALAALFVAANWDRFREFGEWFGNRASTLFTEAIGDIVSGWGNFGQAVTELWNLIKSKLQTDDDSVIAIFAGMAEAVLRAINAIGEVLGGLGNVAAELVRTLTSLFQGDLQGVFDHLGAAVMAALHALSEAFLSLFPEIRAGWDGFWGWMEERARSAGEAIRQWLNPRGPGIGGSRGDGTVRGSAMGDMLKASGAYDPKRESAAVAGAREQAGKVVAERSLGVITTAFVNQATNEVMGAVQGAGFSLRRLLYDILSDLRNQVLQGLANTVQQLFASIFQGGGSGGSTAAAANSGGFLSSIGSFIGSLFSGGFDKGGFIPPGKWGIVGERRPEVAFGGRSGMSVMPMSGGGTAYNDNRSFDLRGASVEAVARLERALAQDRAELPLRVRAEFGNMASRGRFG